MAGSTLAEGGAYTSRCTPAEKAGMTDMASVEVVLLQATMEVSLKHVHAPEWRNH